MTQAEVPTQSDRLTVTRSGRALGIHPRPAPGEQWVYQVLQPLQIGPTQGAVFEDAEMRTDAGPTPHTGSYVEEILTAGPVRVEHDWRF